MAKHSPAPWTFGAPRGGQIRIWGADALPIGTASYGTEEDAECHANARLMASAPDLVTELDAAALALEEAAKLLFAKGLQGCASIMSAHVDKARAAIATATGAKP